MTARELLQLHDAGSVWEVLPEVLAGEVTLFPHQEGEQLPEELIAQLQSTTAAVIQTSGSTGNPKRVELSAEALLASAAATEELLGKGQWLLALPVHYIAGLMVLVRAFVSGEEPVIVRKYSPEEFFERARQLGADKKFTSLVPAQLYQLLEVATEQELQLLRQFDAILIGGQSLSADLADRAAQAGLSVISTYGSTETAGGAVYDGTPLPGVSATVIGEEIALSSPGLATGYLGNSELTHDRFIVRDDQRWYLTGDYGTIREGTVIVAGRKDEIIISGGVKVDLSEVTEVVRTAPGMGSAVLVTLNDDKWGKIIGVAADGRLRTVRIPLEALRAMVTEKLGAAAAPRILHYFDEGIPLTASGKPSRKEIKRVFSEIPRHTGDGE